MADSSTTVPGIPILIAGGCWAQSQLHNGIRYVSIALKLMKLISSVEVVPWRNSTLFRIAEQPVLGFEIGFLEVVGLGGSYTTV